MSKSGLWIGLQRFQLAASSALFKFLWGQRAKMCVPACWLKEEGYPGGLSPSYCSNQQSHRSTYCQQECGSSQLFSISFWPAMRYANKNQHCAKEEEEEKKNYWKRFIFKRCLGLLFEKNSICFYKECIQPRSQSLISFLRELLRPAHLDSFAQQHWGNSERSKDAIC